MTPQTVTVERQFLNLVLAMRHSQKMFFSKKEAYRKESHLQTAKELERQVDAYLAQLQIQLDRLDQFGKIPPTDAELMERIPD